MSAVGNGFWVGMSPLPVEITNRTDPWALWLPPAITLLVGIIALAGAVWSIRAGARQEHRKWEHETILRLGTEALDASITAMDVYSSVGRSRSLVTSADEFEPARRAVAKIQMSGVALRLLGANEAATWSVTLREAFLDDESSMMAAAFSLNRAYYDEKESEESEASEARTQALAHYQSLLSRLSSAQGGFEEALRLELKRRRPTGRMKWSLRSPLVLNAADN